MMKLFIALALVIWLEDEMTVSCFVKSWCETTGESLDVILSLSDFVELSTLDNDGESMDSGIFSCTLEKAFESELVETMSGSHDSQHSPDKTT